MTIRELLQGAPPGKPLGDKGGVLSQLVIIQGNVLLINIDQIKIV